ncbi:hypothetical protein BDP27DRAFT_1401924 [Rhodocollybia butyracea]|uniref:Uncharacterized protein n=1 Tax=Rhodocollybia butyracea TaxID=206335 RepID=A0A9P5PYZ0_9AGAR|nr:hypothetical protein BDP27DRAFT_1401924 [Rhodocollybia butyracea]
MRTDPNDHQTITWDRHDPYQPSDTHEEVKTFHEDFGMFKQTSWLQQWHDVIKPKIQAWQQQKEKEEERLAKLRRLAELEKLERKRMRWPKNKALFSAEQNESGPATKRIRLVKGEQIEPPKKMRTIRPKPNERRRMFEAPPLNHDGQKNDKQNWQKNPKPKLSLAGSPKPPALATHVTPNDKLQDGRHSVSPLLAEQNCSPINWGSPRDAQDHQYGKPSVALRLSAEEMTTVHLPQKVEDRLNGLGKQTNIEIIVAADLTHQKGKKFCSAEMQSDS